MDSNVYPDDEIDRQAEEAFRPPEPEPEPAVERVTKRNLATADPDHLTRYRKANLNFGYPAGGPLIVETIFGDVNLPRHWTGVIMIDDNGFPFPVSNHELGQYWVVADLRDSIAREQPNDSDARDRYAEVAASLDSGKPPSFPIE